MKPLQKFYYSFRLERTEINVSENTYIPNLISIEFK